MGDYSDQSEQASEGNGLKEYQESSCKISLRYFKTKIRSLENGGLAGLESEADRKSMLIASHLNVAVCYIKLQEYDKALEACDKALALEPGNDKAVFRQAQCYMRLNDFDEALQRLKYVIEVDPDNETCKYCLEVCQDELKRQDQRDIKMYRRFFERYHYQQAFLDELGEEHVPKRLLGATSDRSGNLVYMMKWKNGSANIVPSDIINELYPQLVIQFYEDRVVWH